jgi:hypothetical protein
LKRGGVLICRELRASRHVGYHPRVRLKPSLAADLSPATEPRLLVPYTRAVDWSGPLVALLGTVVGASVTLLADRVRWRRDQHQRRYELLRAAYGDYLASLHTTSEEVRAVSLERKPEVSRQSAARAAFRSASLNARREQLVLLAPEPTVRAANETFVALRELRDSVSHGNDANSPGYQEILSEYLAALQRLRNAMRADLGGPPLADVVTF